MKLAKILSTFFGIGYIKKGGGTVAAAAACIIWYLIVTNFYTMRHNLWLQMAVIALIFFTGVWCGNKVEAIWGKDSYRVVWDEVLGMCISLFAVPENGQKWQIYLAAFLLFRFFDIVKPLYIKKTEHFAGGWGVMLDDALAGVYANMVLQIIFIFHIL
jgi:phosphatidylglycerophosphatase A